MRNVLIIAAAGAAGIALAAAPSIAQKRHDEEALRGAAGQIEQAAPAIDRAAGAMLDLDIGPILDAADPYGPRGRHRTLRDIAERDDPGFERRLHGSIYATTAGLSRTMNAIAAAEPRMRRSLEEMESALTDAFAAARRQPARDRDRDADRDDDGDPF